MKARPEVLSDEAWRRLDALLDDALSLAPEPRARFMRELETRNPDDAVRLRRLLCAAEADSPLDHPALLGVEPPQLLPGTIVGPWRIEGSLGSGGMGEVYAASRQDGAYEVKVALKVLRQGVSSPDAARRFRAERQFLAVLEHPNITRLVDGGVMQDGRPYLAMTYVQGRTIDEWSAALGTDVEPRLRLLVKIAGAVHYAHTHLIVHRDLKPANVLVTEDGQPVLLDFGIAKLLDRDDGDGHTQQTQAFTPGWAAPEQLAGLPATTATDVYGLGLLLFTLLTGQRAFEGATDRTEPPAPSSMATGPTQARRLRGDLDAIVRCALAPDPNQRYGSAAALADDLVRHLNDEPVRAPGASRAARLTKALRRHRWPLALGATVVLALAGYAATLTVQARALRAQEAARARAADRADRVSSFVVDLLASGDPGRGPVSVADLVDEGARRLQDDLHDLPLVRREVAVALAEAQLGLGRYEAAGTLAAAALQAFEQHPPVLREAKMSHTKALILQSKVRLRQGRSDEAGALAVAAQDLARQVDDSGRLSADVQAWRGTLAHQRIDLAAALSHYEAAYDGRVAALGQTAAPTITAALRVSEMHANLRDAEPMRRWRDRAAQALRKSDAPARDLVQAHLLMAHLVESTEQQDRWRERAIETLVQVYGEHHPEVAGALNDYGLALESRDLDRSVTYLERALEVTEAYYGQKTPRVVRARLNLGSVLRDAGHLKRAAPLIEGALALGREVYPPTSQHLAYPLTHLSQLRHLQGRLHEAEQLGAELITLLKRHPKLTFHRGVSHYRLAKILLDRQRPLQAEQHLEAAVGLLQPKTQPPFAQATLAWAQVRQARGAAPHEALRSAVRAALASTGTSSQARRSLRQAAAAPQEPVE